MQQYLKCVCVWGGVILKTIPIRLLLCGHHFARVLLRWEKYDFGFQVCSDYKQMGKARFGDQRLK